MAMDPNDVIKDVDLLDRAIDEFGRQATILADRRQAIVTKLKQVGDLSAHYSMHRDRMTKKNPEGLRRARIKALQENSQRVREAKTKRAKKFAEAGTTAEDVLGQLQGASKLDAALKQRKPSRDKVRPVFPVARTG